MAFTLVTFRNPDTGVLKKAPIGFSWSVFVFGFIAPLFRGDIKWAVIMFILACFTGGLTNLVLMFTYNRWYACDLIDAGYQALSITKGDWSTASKKIGMEIPRLEGA
ncbi:hypothetical protein K9857_08650 [Pseudomonas sp. REP124]|uniref:hypothetical protein n=1 Tax=Pseudomonas sp. REP124 TaxID=2875731 RepID=UPI001CCF67E3|nr:hypothetical protein [Pseudomonas sp. REP124]MBZ9781620.1 hypothetical protein [Pseudomonas sp. REP124]